MTNAHSEMQLIFTKGSGKMDRLEFRLHGEKIVEVQNPKQGIIPHDMVHLAVELTFPLKGFIQLVFDGHQPGKIMEVLHGFAPKLEAEFPATSWMAESLVESFQAAVWSKNSSFQDLEYAYLSACDARKITPNSIDEADYKKCMELMEILTLRWRETPIGESLELPFAPKPKNALN